MCSFANQNFLLRKKKFCSLCDLVNDSYTSQSFPVALPVVEFIFHTCGVVPSVHPALLQSKGANTHKKNLYGIWCSDKLIHPCVLAFQMFMS